MNPLLDFSGLPRFSDIKVEHVTPAVDTLLTENRAQIEKLKADPAAPTWENFVQPMEDAGERLARAWGQVGHLHSVMDSPELREVYNANLPKIAQFHAEVGQDEGLFAKFKQLRASSAFETLNRAQKKIIENDLRDFRLGGAELPADKKARFKQIQEELSSLAAKFEENLLDATNAFAWYIEDKDMLRGVPDDVLAAAAAEAQSEGKAGWKLTLRMPCYFPVMQYAENRGLREKLYHAYCTRASEFGDANLDNTANINAMLKLRREEAQLLGYRSFAEVSLVPKMAQSPEEVLAFLEDLGAKAKRFAERDMQELREFARTELGLDTLQAWDIGYASEKLRAKRYAFSEQEVKQYFPEDIALDGMFRVIQTIYGLGISPSQAPSWHPDVKFFDIRDAGGALVGQFYMDLYARATKRGGAWMDDAITRRRRGTGIQTPVAYLNCNFPAPVKGEDGKLRPALFTHDEVMTLFHEFGHGLHHLLTRVEQLGVAGINGVEWDAVELPSQFMENFCWEWDVLEHMTRHVDTGANLPRELYEKMVAAKNFQSGMQMMRQIEFSLFDMHLHHDFDPLGSQTPQQLLDGIRKRVAVVNYPPYNRFQNSFSHIFAGGYAAGYYSYKWAEVLSADAYALFEELGVLSQQAGQRFREEILAVGGSRPAMESFVAFRGRQPTVDALLRHNGLAVA